MQLQHGESRKCDNCHKLILGPGGWGINPSAVCHCNDPMAVAPTQQGCICPPRSEETCKALMCPRRGMGVIV
jgi:hypothetical protein